MDNNPYADKKAKVYGPELLKELDQDEVRQIVAEHGEGMLTFYDEHKNTDWTDEDTLRLVNTRVGRARLNKIRLKQNVNKLKGYFRR